MNLAQIKRWIQHPELLNKDTLYELRTLVAGYPYFQSLRLLYLKNLYLLHDCSFADELRKSVLYVADRRVLFYLIEGEYFTSTFLGLEDSSQNEELGIDRTLTLINAFLAANPQEEIQSAELDYSTDYVSYLLQDETTGKDEDGNVESPRLYGQELIDDFIRRSEEPSTVLPADEESAKQEITVREEEQRQKTASEDTLDDSCFTETLAKIYVKQQRYDKALEIIKKLSLNYPKKNAYFADQIRFLEKLIINAKSK